MGSDLPAGLHRPAFDYQWSGGSVKDLFNSYVSNFWFSNSNHVNVLKGMFLLSFCYLCTQFKHVHKGSITWSDLENKN